MTEDEVIRGIINNTRASETSLAFFRKINYAEEDKSSMLQHGYLDSKPEYQAWLDVLKKSIEKELSHQNRNYFEV